MSSALDLHSRVLFEPIFLTDSEIAKRLGMSSAGWEAVAHVLERQGLPPRDPLFSERRCWPTVRDFLLRRSVGGALPTSEPEGQIVENLNALRSTGRRRARA